jgi:hypothetical protein
MKRFGATSFFAIIVAILVVFTAYDYWSAQKKEASNEADLKVVRLNKDEVNLIEITDTKVALRLEKVDGHWQIVKPFAESADQQMVFTFLDQMTGEKIAQVVKEGEIDPKIYGLSLPLFNLTIATSSAKQSVKVGSIKAFDGSLYGQIDEQKKVVLLNSSWDVLMTKPAKDFRDTKLYHGSMTSDFDRIQVKSRDANFELLHKVVTGTGQYTLKGSTDPVVQGSVQAWLEQIKALRGAAFVDDPKPGFKPDYSITLTRTGSDPYVLEIARDHAHSKQFEVTSTDLPGRFASRVLAGQSAIGSVAVRPDIFYSKKAPFEFKTADVTEMKFHDAKSGKDLDTKIDPTHPDVLLSKIAALEAVRFMGPAEHASEKKFPSHLTLLKSDGSVVFEMSWGEVVTEGATADRPESRYLPVKTNLFKQVVGVPELQIAALGAQPELKPKKVDR